MCLQNNRMRTDILPSQPQKVRPFRGDGTDERCGHSANCPPDENTPAYGTGSKFRHTSRHLLRSFLSLATGLQGLVVGVLPACRRLKLG